MKAEPEFQRWEFEVPQLDLPLLGLVQALLEHRDASPTSSLMINSEIPHDCCNWGFIFSEEFLKSFVGGLVRGNECSLPFSLGSLSIQAQPSGYGGLCMLQLLLWPPGAVLCLLRRTQHHQPSWKGVLLCVLLSRV